MAYPKIDPKSRFFSRIVCNSGDGECWEWVGAKDQDGYGILQLSKGVSARAHRLCYEWFVGPIPEGLQVLHHCDNPSCVRPTHLFLGTHEDNKKDSALKGRLSGIYNPNSNYRRSNGKPEYPRTKFEITNSPQAGGGQPVQGAPSPAAGGGAGLLPQQSGPSAVGGATGVEAPGGGRVNV